RRASYFGTAKVNAQVVLKSICMNLKKAANKIFVDEPSKRGAVRPQCSIRVRNSFEKGVKLHFSVKKTRKSVIWKFFPVTATKLSGLCKRSFHRGRYKSLTRQQRRWLKRRQAVEPAIGHLKSDHRMDRCWLQGKLGDALHAVLCAAGYNLRWLLRAIVRLGLKAVFLRLLLIQLINPIRSELITVDVNMM
ncbi:transposase, partial [Nitrosomonas communis]|uniref:transposase n=1 Tax=Nitrosomonas communis TaxID=44574 RepID=UPI0026F0B1A5